MPSKSPGTDIDVPGSGTTVIRAAISLILLLGFYLLAAVCTLGVGAATVYAAWWIGGGFASIKTLLVGGGIALAIIVGAARSLRTKPFRPYGKRLLRDDARKLWALVDDTARRVGTRSPDEIWLDGDVNAGVVERTKMLGLIGGRRYLMLGLPLLTTMSVDQLRGILAHELGHYASSHTKLTALSYRGHLAVGNMLRQFAHRRFNPVTWVFMGYGALYGVVQNAVSRRQELEADRVAGRIAGRTHMRTALREIPILSTAWATYLDDYVAMGLDVGLAPRGVYAGFSKFVDGHAARFAELRDARPPSRKSKWDTHPPIAERVLALANAPDSPEVHSTEAATDLLPDFGKAESDVEELFIDVGDREVLDWPQYVERSFLARKRRTAESAYRAIRRVTGADSARLESLLDGIETLGGEQFRAQLAKANFPPQWGYSSMLLAAAHDSKAVRFVLKWNGRLSIERPDGTEFAVMPLADALAEADTDDIAKLRVRLTEAGIVLTKATGGTTTADADLARAQGALANMKFDGEPHDLIVTNEGLLFLSCPKSTDNGEKRLRQLLTTQDGVRGMSKRPDARWLPYEEITTVVIRKHSPIKAEVTLHNGTAHEFGWTWTGEEIGKSSDLLHDVLADLAEDTD